MRFRVAVAGLVIGLAACSSTPGQPAAATSSATPSTSAPTISRALSNCPDPVTAIFAVHLNAANGGITGDSIFCVSVAAVHDVTSLQLESPVEHRELLAADARSIVQVDGGNVVGVFDPVSEKSRTLGTLSALGVGDPGPLGAVMSPDGTQFALGGAHKLLLVDVQSGTARTLATIPGDRWLTPVLWTASGIIARKVGYEGMGDFGLAMVDPATGTVSMINQGPNNQIVISPDGRFLVSTTHVDLGDQPAARYPMQNAIDMTAPDGTTTRIATQKDRWFIPLDVTNDGQVLFASDSQTVPVAPDMGLYVAKAGHNVLQLPSDFPNEWQAARFVGASTALVVHLGGGNGTAETSINFEAIQMCTDTGCHVETSGDAIIEGQWPTLITSIVMLPAPA